MTASLIALFSLLGLTMAMGGLGGNDDPEPVEPTGPENLNLMGTEGADTLSGEEGDDTLDGATGNDLLTGGAGNDVLFAGDGQDSLAGGAGNDSLFSWNLEEYDDFMGSYGDAGPSNLSGEEGNDTLYGMVVGDSLYGGAGDDLLLIDESQITAEGGDGNDTFTTSDSAMTYLDSERDNVTVRGGAGDDRLRFTGADQDLFGEDGNDTLSADFGDGNGLYGGVGDDYVLMGSQGGSCGLYGGEGNDTVFSDTVGDKQNVGDGNRLYGGDGDDLVEQQYRDASTLSGGAGNDTFAVWDFDYDWMDGWDGSTQDAASARAITINDFNPAEDQLILGTADGTAPVYRIEMDTVAREARVYLVDPEFQPDPEFPEETAPEYLALRVTNIDSFDASMLRFEQAQD